MHRLFCYPSQTSEAGHVFLNVDLTDVTMPDGFSLESTDAKTDAKTFAGFYFFYPYNARLVATEAALVHRYLTYLWRA